MNIFDNKQNKDLNAHIFSFQVISV